ncbi:hypothetical protein C5167_031242 [Papaver somniferum]|nr:hypothetical protein C5167_031242 [Papaver somniferum]
MAVMMEQAVLDREEENIKVHADSHGLHESTQDLQRMDAELDAHEREFLLGYYISCIKLYGAKKKLFKADLADNWSRNFFSCSAIIKGFYGIISFRFRNVSEVIEDYRKYTGAKKKTTRNISWMEMILASQKG